MRARTLLLLLLAVILAGGTALLARNYLAQTKEAVDKPSIVVATPAKSVLVARADIKRGQILRPEDSVWQIWPEGGLDKNYVVLGGPRTPEAFAGWVAKNPIAGGDPITETKIIKPGDRGYLAAVLRPGMRAISVPVTVTSGISGFVFPGDQVDLMMTYSVPARAAPSGGEAGKSTYEHKAAETMLRNIRVIAIDQRLESKAGEAFPAHTATLEVTAKQSEAIVLASEIGKMTLSLRSLVPGPHETPTDDQTVADQTVALTANKNSPDSSKNSPDSSIAALATYTLDDEINPLLPKYVGGKDASKAAPDAATEGAAVTILRGGGKASESTAPQPAAKGS
jgi:pilus assembly protein CpaB